MLGCVLRRCTVEQLQRKHTDLQCHVEICSFHRCSVIIGLMICGTCMFLLSNHLFCSTRDGFEVLCCTETFSVTPPRNHRGDRKSGDNWVAPELLQEASSLVEVSESPSPKGLSQSFSFQRFWLPQANQHSEKWSAGVGACSQLGLWWPCGSGEARLFWIWWTAREVKPGVMISLINSSQKSCCSTRDELRASPRIVGASCKCAHSWPGLISTLPRCTCCLTPVDFKKKENGESASNISTWLQFPAKTELCP